MVIKVLATLKSDLQVSVRRTPCQILLKGICSEACTYWHETHINCHHERIIYTQRIRYNLNFTHVRRA